MLQRSRSNNFKKGFLIFLGLFMLASADPCGDTDFSTAPPYNPCVHNVSRVEDKTRLTRNNGTFYLQTPAAKKDCHALMSVCATYANEEYAVDNPFVPSINLTFGANDGFFPTPTPERECYKKDEQGRCFFKWCWEVERGARNDPAKYVKYYISVNSTIDLPADGLKDVNLEAFILYNPYQEEEEEEEQSN